MSLTPSVTYQGQNYQGCSNETVLDCLLRHGLPIEYGCQSGNCHRCKQRALSGDLGGSSKGLSPTEADQGLFLACQCKLKGQIILADQEASAEQLKVIERHVLSNGVLKLVLQEPSFQFKAGQFIHLANASGESRCYSIAHPEHLELHVGRIPGGTVSTLGCMSLLRLETS